MEEFRRRKNLKEYWGSMTDMQRRNSAALKDPTLMPVTNKPEFLNSVDRFGGSNAERFFEPDDDDIFDPNEF